MAVLDRGEVPKLTALQAAQRHGLPLEPGVLRRAPRARRTCASRTACCPSGPTVVDEMANAAFFFGLMSALSRVSTTTSPRRWSSTTPRPTSTRRRGIGLQGEPHLAARRGVRGPGADQGEAAARSPAQGSRTPASTARASIATSASSEERVRPRPDATGRAGCSTRCQRHGRRTGTRVDQRSDAHAGAARSLRQRDR